MFKLEKVLVNRIVNALYELGLWILAVVALPKFFYEMIFKKKYRKSFFNRLGLGLPTILPSQHPVIWIHAISLGETKAVVALARELKKRYPEGTLIISSITETGHQEAEKCIPFADHHIYLPFDFNFLAKLAVKKLSPDLVLLCESDFWFNFLRHAKKGGACIGLVNGKISQKSANRFTKFPLFSKKLFDLFDIFCFQNTLYRDRFLEIGVPLSKTHVTGNLKFDDEYPQLSAEEVKNWRKKLGIEPHQFVLTIGSTHDPEETLFLEVLEEVWKVKPELKVLLIPRHPERYNEVARLLEKKSATSICFTEINSRTGKEQITLMNAMGLLRMCYQLSDLSIVGGSYTPRIGGHNILEPCWYGKPVIFGPYMHGQLEFMNIVKHYESGYQIGIEELASQLSHLLDNESIREQTGKRGIQMMEDLKGSTERTLQELDTILKQISAKKNPK